MRDWNKGLCRNSDSVHFAFLTDKREKVCTSCKGDYYLAATDSVGVRKTFCLNKRIVIGFLFLRGSQIDVKMTRFSSANSTRVP